MGHPRHPAKGPSVGSRRKAPAGRWRVATGESSAPQAHKRNPWSSVAILFLAPEGAKGLCE